MKLNKQLITFFATIVAVFVLIYSSYETGYKRSENKFGALTMMINIDSNIVTTGIYESLPNDVKRTLQFSFQSSPTIVSDIKLFAEVKYITVGGEAISVDDGKIWNYVKREQIYQRQLNGKDKDLKDGENKKEIKGSNLAFMQK